MRPSASLSSCLFLVAAVALTLVGSSDAALIAHEPFNYASDSGTDLNGDGKFDLNGLNGGTGFSGAWVDENSSLAPDHSYDYIQSGSMLPPTNWADLETSGNSLRSINTVSLETTVWRPLAPIDISAPRTLWMSFLVSRVSGGDNTGSQYFTLMLSPDDVLEDVKMLEVGDGNDGKNYALYGDGVKEDSGIEMLGAGGTNPVTPVPALLVVKMVFDPAGDDRFELFVSPTPRPEPLVPDAILEDLDLTALNFVGFRSGNSTSRQWSLDEIRIGDTYADVTPVPEPTAGLMSLVGAAALGFRRRRR